MPCSGPSYDVHAEYQYQLKEMKTELDLTTRLLCRTIRTTIRDAKKRGVPVKDDPAYLALMAVPEMKAWWTAHKALDRQRKAAEVIKAKAALLQAKRDIKKAERQLERAKAAVAESTQTLKAKIK